MKRRFLEFLLTIISIIACRHEFEIQESSTTVIAANLYVGNSLSEEVTAEILSYDADFVILIELTPSNFDIKAAGEQGYHSVIYYSDSGVDGIGILSKYPGDGVHIPVMVEDESLTGTATISCMPMASFSTVVAGEEITLLGVHVPPPFYYGYDVRKKVINFIVETADSRTIIAGDFNTFSWQSTMEGLLEDGFVDAFDIDGNRDTTWPPIARIDYIIAPEDFSITFTGTIDIPGSDHRAVICGLDFPK